MTTSNPARTKSSSRSGLAGSCSGDQSEKARPRPRVGTIVSRVGPQPTLGPSPGPSNIYHSRTAAGNVRLHSRSRSSNNLTAAWDSAGVALAIANVRAWNCKLTCSGLIRVWLSKKRYIVLLRAKEGCLQLADFVEKVFSCDA